MATEFEPIPTVESWQLSNAPILALAPMRASLDLISQAGGMAALRTKSEKQIAFFDRLLSERLDGRILNISPSAMHERGCQFALQVLPSTGQTGRQVFEQLEHARVLCDWREPDVIRVAPVPLYNSFSDIERFVDILAGIMQ